MLANLGHFAAVDGINLTKVQMIDGRRLDQDQPRNTSSACKSRMRPGRSAMALRWLRISVWAALSPSSAL
jgi:hypothetical protein